MTDRAYIDWSEALLEVERELARGSRALQLGRNVRGIAYLKSAAAALGKAIELAGRISSPGSCNCLDAVKHGCPVHHLQAVEAMR